MARLRRDTLSPSMHQPPHTVSHPSLSAVQSRANRSKPLRIFCCGTIFLTQTLSIPSHPSPGSATRAQRVETVRGGSAGKVLSMLAQFGRMGFPQSQVISPGQNGPIPVVQGPYGMTLYGAGIGGPYGDVEPMLIASLGGSDDAVRLKEELEREGVSTRYCKVYEGMGVPCAWVMAVADSKTRTVINHNPLPDISHEEFIVLLGSLLAPENYAHITLTPPPSLAPPIPVAVNPPIYSSASAPRASSSLPRSHFGIASPIPTPNPLSPAPFDWLHFEGRSVKTTLNNLVGLDGLARERKWRAHCVFSVDVGRRARQGVEALFPHVDVIFLTHHYARSHSSQYAATPRAFLLSFARLASPHALLVANWGSEGAALLSVPTKEYFQSSGWVDDRFGATGDAASSNGPSGHNSVHPGGGVLDISSMSYAMLDEMESVRSGSDFWAGRSLTPESSGYTAGADLSDRSMTLSALGSRSRSMSQSQARRKDVRKDVGDDDDSTSQSTETPSPRLEGIQEGHQGAQVDEESAHDAFVAGMIYALSRRILPGSPYTPLSGTAEVDGEGRENERTRGRWRIDECLRFATELSGRRACRKGWEGLADEMRRANWFD